MLGICDYNSYEGQCAMLLEDAAARAQKGGPSEETDMLALDFHMQIVDLIMEQCRKIREKTGTDKVVLTGGTFQNRILMEETLAQLRSEGFDPYYNISVSPNDGGIALGQSYIAAMAHKGKR
jgi:hydrogenase maturation protein HypF